jgi:hypothetical protein
MGKSPKLEVLDIPESAFQPKPWYMTREDAEAALPVIRRWIKEGNPPYLFSGHTHSEPSPDTRIEYLDEFEIPKEARSRKNFAPCPCCTPHHPKYALGRIAWFPDEAVIRLMGAQCFASLNAQAHTEATDRMRAEKRRRQEVAYLLGNRDVVPKMLGMLRSFRPAVQALVKAQLDVSNCLRRMNIDLWQHVRTGTLIYSVKETVTTADRSGEHTSRELDREEVYGNISGEVFYKAEREPLFGRLSEAITALEEANSRLFSSPEAVNNLSDKERHRMAKRIETSFRKAQDVLAAYTERRKGISEQTTATLRNWSQVPGSPLPWLYIRRDGNRLFLGQSELSVTRIELDESINLMPGPLPALAIASWRQPD